MAADRLGRQPSTVDGMVALMTRLYPTATIITVPHVYGTVVEVRIWHETAERMVKIDARLVEDEALR